MIAIRFPDEETQRLGLGFLVKHFSGRAFKSGVHHVSEEALKALTAEQIPFSVVGPVEEVDVSTES